MANFQEGSSRISLPSGYDFTATGTTFNAPYTLVKLSAGKVVPVAAITDNAIGVLMNCPDASGTADVLAVNQAGSGKVVAGGTISAGALITFNSSGQAVAATQTAGGTAAAVRVIGQALEAAVSGQVFEYLSKDFLY